MHTKLKTFYSNSYSSLASCLMNYLHLSAVVGESFIVHTVKQSAYQVWVMWTTSKLNEINLHACIQTICARTQQLVLTACLHWQCFTERAPACSILSCHFHTVCSLRFQSSHCVLLNPSSQRYAASRTATVSLPILQYVGSVGGAG